MLRIVVLQVLILVCSLKHPSSANHLAKLDSASLANDTTLFFLKFQHRITNDLDSGNFKVNTGLFSIPLLNLRFASLDTLTLFPDNPYPQSCFFSLNPSFSYLGQKPLTIVQTEVNTNKEQLFYLGHKRDIGKSSGLWFKLFSFRSPGVFANALGNAFNIDWGGYSSLKKMKVRLDAYHRKETFQLNGGVEPNEGENSFAFLGNSRKLLQPKWSNLNLRKISTGYHFELVFPTRFFPVDSVYKDLKDSSKLTVRPIASGFKLFSNYELNYFFLNQEVLPEDTFLLSRPALFDTAITKDRLRGSIISNSLLFFKKSKFKSDFFETGLTHAYAEQNQNFYKSFTNSLFIGLKGGFYFRKILSTAKIDYGLLGYNTGNFLGSLNLLKEIFWGSYPSLFEVNIMSSKMAPTLLQRSNFSNHFSWTNDFSDVQKGRLMIRYKRNNISGSLGYESIRNFIYFNSEGVPLQVSERFSYYFVNLNTNLETRNFFIFPEFLFQKDLSNGQILRIPEFVVKSIVGFRWRLFKKALILSPGIDLLFASKFYGNYFLPQTGQFIRQDSQITGSYLAANFFVNFIIKDLKGYIKMDHINDGTWPENPGYFIAGYPLQGRVIRIGFIWNLVN